MSAAGTNSGRRQGEHDPHDRSLAGPGVRLDAAAVHIQHAVNHRQAQAPVAILGRKKGLDEHLSSGLVRQSRTLVRHPHLDVRAGGRAAQEPRHVGRGQFHQPGRHLHYSVLG